MFTHTWRDGETVTYLTRDEIEGHPSYKPEGGGRRGRLACLAHGGDNPQGLSIDWETGRGKCWTRGCTVRVADHPRTTLPHEHADAAPAAPRHDPAPIAKREEPPALTPQQRASLEDAVFAAVDRLPGSPGERYLAGRGIPLDVAQDLGIGWAERGQLAGRVTIPLTDDRSTITSATGRAILANVKPKYRALPAREGYTKTLFNGAAIDDARRDGVPLLVVEGPFDAAACVAGGIPHVVAICGAAYAFPEHFRGVENVLLALDADDAGTNGRKKLHRDLADNGVRVIEVDTAALLDGEKDLAEYVERHHDLPAALHPIRTALRMP